MRPVGPLRAALAATLAASLGAGARPARADPTPSLAFEPAPATDRGFGVESAAVRGHKLVAARVLVDGAREPLVLRNAAQVEDRAVTSLALLHLLVSVSLWHRLAIHADLPFVLHQGGEAAPNGLPAAPRPTHTQGVGDLRLGARVVLWASPEDAPTRGALALAASLWVPTGSEYGGDGAARARGALVASVTGARLYGGLVAGVRSRPGEELAGALPTRVGTALSLAGAAGFFVGARRDLALGLELEADLRLGGGARLGDPRATVGQLLAAGHLRILGGPFELGAALGPGFGAGPGAADYRVLALVGWAPETPPPPPDGDADGVPDKIDACPTLPGVPSQDPLLHGCPEAPRDRDGDGIPDANDACPRVPGEATGVRATHGCPPPAPPEEEPPPPPLARLEEQAIVITQQVLFETDTAVLRGESEAVLGAVAEVLAQRPEIELVEVEGHTDDIGTPEHNRALGKARAESVTAWLVAHGVARGRLSAKGYGSDRALVSNATEEGRAKNRRVELRVVRAAPRAAEEKP